MKRILPLLLSFLICSGVALADSGLLLGFRQPIETPDQPEAFGPEQQFEYFTVWIYPTDNGYTYARGPNLLVPRGEGFWEVGVKRQNTQTWVEDHPYAYPVMSPKSERTFAVQDGTSGHKSSKITWVGPKGMSIITHSAGYSKGAAHPWNTWSFSTEDLDKLGKPVKVQTVYSKAGGTALVDGYHRYVREHPQRSQHLEEEARSSSWGLMRESGHWKTLGFVGHGAEVYRGSYALFPLALPVHKKVSAHDKLDIEWAKIKKKIPGALDAFQGPDGAPIVVLTKDHFHVFETFAEPKPLLTVNLQGPSYPVMAEWALGTNVRRWTASVFDFIGADI